ncbi:DNA primase family protein [Halobacteriovorax sp. JY17]|uniref:DNA primase family protein n=1 Tax=Halobacteriovorax sp. JY17 TaxID=2014617 RepID=UPI000C6357B9|nr:DNA primase family protein [Halobacteriovorax sp. JY17]PIK15090.1 MAG: hypothetical protein CES88_12210 [Halobacteriovorax sp. JY17]
MTTRELVKVKIVKDEEYPAHKLADEYIEIHAGHLIFYNGSMYYRHSNKYRKFENLSKFKLSVLVFLNSIGCVHYLLNSKVENITTAIKAKTTLNDERKPPFFLENDRKESFISLENGLLNINHFLKTKEVKIHKHTPSYFCTTCFEYPYIKDAIAPTWQKILDESLPDKDVQRSLQQLIGNALRYSNKHESMVFFLGKGRNGKSLILFIIRLLLGEDNISTLPLEDFGRRFSLYRTIGKLANIIGEVSDSSKLPETSIKSYISGEPFQADIKFQDPVIVYPTARIFAALNTFPGIRDTSDGFYRRIRLFPFKHQVPEEEVRPELMTDEFWNKSGELPGIFNWALEGLYDLETNGLLKAKGCEDVLREIRTLQNPVIAFLEEFIVQDEGSSSLAKHIHDKYSTFCVDHGYIVKDTSALGKAIRNVFPLAKQGGFASLGGGKRSRKWINIRLKKQDEFI